MANENKTTIVFDGDTSQLEKDINKSFNKVQKQAIDFYGTGLANVSGKTEKEAVKQGMDIGQAFGDAFSGGFSVSRVTSLLGPVGMVVTSLGLAGAALAKFTFEGEKLDKIQKNFDAISNSFGIAGDKLQDAFIGATGGIVDDDDALQLLNEKMIQFNGQVKDLPALMELSRKASNLFGRDALDVFDSISSAIATGNFKQLKFLIPKLDADKVIGEYAFSLGKLKSELTDAEKIQGLTNAIMKEGGERLKGISVEAGTASEAWERLKVSVSNVYEAMQVGTAKQTGGFFKSFFDTARMAIEGELLQEPKGNAALQDAMVKRYDLIAQKQDLVKSKEEAWFGVRKTAIQNQINQTDALIKQQDDIIKKQEEAIQKAGEAKKAASKPEDKAEAVVPGMSPGKMAAFEKFNNDLNQKLMQSKLAMLQTELGYNKNIENLDKLHEQQLISNRQQGVNDRMALFTQMKQAELISESDSAKFAQLIAQGKLTGNKMVDDLLLKQMEDQKNKKLAIDKQYVEQKKLVDEQAQASDLSNKMAFQDGIVSGFQAMYDSLKVAGEKASKDFENLSKKIGSIALNSLAGGISKGVQKMALAWRDGKVGLEDFGQAFLGVMGDMMVQMGNAFIAQAAAMFFSPDTTMSAKAPGLMAGGIGLVAAGTLLGASVGSSPSPSASGGGVSGGSTGVSSGTTSLTAPEDKIIAEQKASVNLTVQGNILNNRDSALYLAEVLEDGFRDQAIKFRGV